MASQTTALLTASIVTGLNVTVASGFALAGLINPQLIAGATANQAASIFAMYAAARTLPLALFAFGAIFYRSIPALFILGALTGVIQFLDAGSGLAQQDAGKTIGPLLIAVAQTAALLWLWRTVRANRT